jgi:hypothetical protein
VKIFDKKLKYESPNTIDNYKQIVNQMDNSANVPLSNPIYCQNDDCVLDSFDITGNVYILCLKDASYFDKILPFVNLQFLKKEDFNTVVESLCIFRSTYGILKNGKYRQNYKFLKKEVLDLITKDIEEDSHTFVILDVNVDILKSVYLYKSYTDSAKVVFNDLWEYVVNYSVLETSEYQLYKYVKSKVETLKGVDYWCIQENCKGNMTIPFVRKKFRMEKCKKQFDKELFDNIMEEQKENGNYIDMMLRKSGYVDASTMEDKNGKKVSKWYKLEEYPLELKGLITKIFGLLDANCFNRTVNYLFSSLAKTKHYYHLVINNSAVLTLMHKHFINYSEYYRYLFFYPMRTAYLEEGLIKKKMTVEDRCVFTIEDARSLPVFNCPESITPYLPLNVNRTSAGCDMMRNLFGVRKYVGFQRGVVSLSEFRKRLCIFSSANQNRTLVKEKLTSIFDGLEWNGEFALCGSLMSFAVPKCNPLMVLFDKAKNNIYEKWYRLSREYYALSDIDIMVNTEDYGIFKKLVNGKLLKTVRENLEKYNPVVDLKVKEIYHAYIVVNDNFIRKYLEDDFNDVFKIMRILKSKEDTMEKVDYKRKIFEIAKQDYKKNYGMQLKEQFLVADLEDIDIRLKYLGKGIDVVMCNVLDSVKIKISSKLMEHDLEVFPTPGGTAIGVVSQFHLPCVRSYYDGEMVYMTPSFVFSSMTRTNIDTKYFSGNDDAIAIILKYLQRGFGTLLNDIQKKSLLKYVRKVPKYADLFENNISQISMYNYHNLSLRFYKPRQYSEDDYRHLENVEVDYLSVMGNIYVEDTVDFFKIEGLLMNEAKIYRKLFSPINTKGFLQPFNNGMIEMYDKFEYWLTV